MDYKILEKIGIETENVDGGAFNNFTAGGESGIIEGVLNECKVVNVGNTLTISSGLLLLSGIRIKLISSKDFSIVGTPAVTTNYHLVAKVVLASDKNVDFDIFVRTEQALIKDNLYEKESGTYELEIAKFIHNTNGNIENLKQTCKVLGQLSLRNGTGLNSVVLYSPAKPNTAEAERSVTLGGNNTNKGVGALLKGLSNVNGGAYTDVGGYSNEIYGNYVLVNGSNLKNGDPVKWESLSQEEKNKYADYAVLLGANSENLGGYRFITLIGVGHTATQDKQVKLGRYTTDRNGVIYAVGCGTKDIPKDAIAVIEQDGEVKVELNEVEFSKSQLEGLKNSISNSIDRTFFNSIY